MIIAVYLFSLEPPKPVLQQSVVPADVLFESQAKMDLFSDSSVSSKKKKNQTNTKKYNPSFSLTGETQCLCLSTDLVLALEAMEQTLLHV